MREPGEKPLWQGGDNNSAGSGSARNWTSDPRCEPHNSEIQHHSSACPNIFQHKRPKLFLCLLNTQNRVCLLSWDLLRPMTLNLLDLMANNALTGRRNIIPTIIIGKMEMELPAMYIMNRFIGICLKGPRAMSQVFCNHNISHQSNKKEISKKGKRDFVWMYEFMIQSCCWWMKN